MIRRLTSCLVSVCSVVLIKRPFHCYASFQHFNSHVPLQTHAECTSALNRCVGDRCCRIEIDSALYHTASSHWFKWKEGEGAVFSRSKWCMRRGNVTREKRVNVWNCWPTDQALPHHHRRRHRQHRSVRESGVAAGGGPGYLTRRTRLCKGSHVRRAFWHGFHREDVKRALQPGARASTVRQRLIIKEPN